MRRRHPSSWRIFFTLLTLLLVGCGRAQPALTPTIQITPTPTPTLTPTLTPAPANWFDKDSPALILSRMGNGIPADLELSPDGKVIAVGGNLGVLFYDFETQDLLDTIPTQAEVTSLTWSPGGDRIAAGMRDGAVIIWDARTGEQLKSLRGDASLVLDVAWSPDGRRLACVSIEHYFLWDPDTGEGLLMLDAHSSDPSLSWTSSADGENLQAWGPLVWDGQAGFIFQPMIGDGSLVDSVSWSPDGRTLAGVTRSGNLIVWDTQTGERLLQQYDGYSLTHVDWSPDGTLLAWSTQEGKIVVWDYPRGERLRILEGPGTGMMGEIFGLTWARDSQTLIAGSASEMLIMWDARTGNRLRSLGGSNGWMLGLSWAPDGERLATVSSGGELIVWDARNGTQVSAFGEELGWLSSVAWSPDGRFLASGDDSSVTLWDATTGKQVDKQWGHVHGVHDIAWSPDGLWLASCSEGVAYVWDISLGEKRSTLQDFPRYGSTSLAWSPTGDQLVSGWKMLDPENSGIAIWDARTGEPLRYLLGHTNAVEDAAWSPDGSRLASAGDDRAVVLWDAQTGEQLTRLFWEDDLPTHVAWSPDGKLLAIGFVSSAVILWDPGTGEELRHLPGHRDMIDDLAWSPRGDLLAASSRDGTLVVWGMGP